MLNSLEVDDQEFIRALESGDLELIAQAAKADLHNHASLGFRKSELEQWMNEKYPDAPAKMESFQEFSDYLNTHFHPIIYSREGFEFSIKAALKHALEDRIVLLEMSIDSQVIQLYENGADGLIGFLHAVHMESAPNIQFRPDIGMNRELDVDILSERVIPLIDSGYFTGVDLYGNEHQGPPEQFVELFRYARLKGLKLKAHAGEYQTADFVRHSVETLELDEVQHGIAAAESREVLNWLQRHKIRLNICPTSNLRLCRVKAIADHPVREIVDAGVPVTINSDDILVFDQSVSEEYLLLFQHGLFSAQELDALRRDALNNIPS